MRADHKTNKLVIEIGDSMLWCRHKPGVNIVLYHDGVVASLCNACLDIWQKTGKIELPNEPHIVTKQLVIDLVSGGSA